MIVENRLPRAMSTALEIRSSRSLRGLLWWGQCRKRCSLFSDPVWQMHMGLEHWNLCLNLCSRRSLNWTRKRVSSRTPLMPLMPKNDFLAGLTKRTSSFLNTEIVGDFLMVSSDWFHSLRRFWKYVWENRSVLLTFGSYTLGLRRL